MIGFERSFRIVCSEIDTTSFRGMKQTVKKSDISIGSSDHSRAAAGACFLKDNTRYFRLTTSRAPRRAVEPLSVIFTDCVVVVSFVTSLTTKPKPASALARELQRTGCVDVITTGRSCHKPGRPHR
jgi:hypothetical protein